MSNSKRQSLRSTLRSRRFSINAGTARLPLDRRPLHHARDALIGADLIAFEPPLYQVLSLDNEAPATPAERTGARPRRLSEVLRQMGTPT